jgi:hypothetical protein
MHIRPQVGQVREDNGCLRAKTGIKPMFKTECMGEHKVRPYIGFGHWLEFGFGLMQTYSPT